MKPDEINKEDRVVEKSQDWIYYSPEHPYNECKERIVRYGTVIAKSKYGVLIDWDGDTTKPDWIGYNKFYKSLGYSFYGMKSNTYKRFEKVEQNGIKDI